MPDPMALLSGLTPAERTRLLERLRARTLRNEAEPGTGTAASVCRIDRSMPMRASFWQEQMWYLDQLSPGAANYNAPFAFDLQGPLTVDVLAKTLSHIAARHEILRTSLIYRDAVVLQVIAPQSPVPLSYIDLSDEADPQAAARAVAVAAARTPFGLVQPPLHRALLIRVDRHGMQHVLVWVASHAVADGWSVGVLVRELALLYPALAAGQRIDLPPLPFQFADYAAWQHEQISGDRLDGLMDYWRRQLSGAPPLRFPFDSEPLAMPSFRGATHEFELPPSLCADIERTGRAIGVTTFVVLLSAYKVLLARWTEQQDFVVGTATAGRTRPELEPLIGPFQNTIGVRTDLSDDPSFEAFCRRVRRTMLEGLSNQDVPLAKLVAALNPQRIGGRNPIWQTFFQFGSLPAIDLDVRLTPSLTMTCSGIANSTVKFDFELTLEPRYGRFVGRFDYAADLLSARTAAAFCEDYELVLRQVVEDRSRPVSALSITGRDRKPKLPESPEPKRSQAAGINGGSVRPVAWPRHDANTVNGHPGPDCTTSHEDVELRLMRMWREALRIESLTPADDFFALGGHSLLATQMVAQIRKEFLVEVSLRQFLTSCSVAGVAALIGRSRNAEPAEDALSILDRVEAMSSAEVAALLREHGVAQTGSVPDRDDRI